MLWSIGNVILDLATEECKKRPGAAGPLLEACSTILRALGSQITVEGVQQMQSVAGIIESGYSWADKLFAVGAAESAILLEQGCAQVSQGLEGSEVPVLDGVDDGTLMQVSRAIAIARKHLGDTVGVGDTHTALLADLELFEADLRSTCGACDPLSSLKVQSRQLQSRVESLKKIVVLNATAVSMVSTGMAEQGKAVKAIWDASEDLPAAYAALYRMAGDALAQNEFLKGSRFYALACCALEGCSDDDASETTAHRTFADARVGAMRLALQGDAATTGALSSALDPMLLLDTATNGAARTLCEAGKTMREEGKNAAKGGGATRAVLLIHVANGLDSAAMEILFAQANAKEREAKAVLKQVKAPAMLPVPLDQGLDVAMMHQIMEEASARLRGLSSKAATPGYGKSPPSPP